MTTACKKVMLIDDSALDLHVTSQVIRNNKFADQILEFTNPLAAILFLEENQFKDENLPTVIFLDLYMPIISGFNFIELYTKLPISIKHYCKIFILSSTISDADIAQIMNDCNTCTFLTKPLTPEKLDSIRTHHL